MERKETIGAAPEVLEAFPQEAEHLRELEEKIALELRAAQESVDKMDQEYREAQQYIADSRGEGDPKEMFQTQMLMGQIDDRGASAVVYRDRLKKTRSSPYFARIDFEPDDGSQPGSYYIGLYAFRFQRELLVIDWRSPVASMFYDFELGPAHYDAPEVHGEGRLTLKRQFKIQDGWMEYAFDSSQNIQDDILQKELAHTSDEKMKSIISTIQKEQNQIIRDEKADTLIIQGVAGSGKTSIALHRVAFLLYRFRNTIKAQNVTIISPNKVFGDYIAGVLPELGEEPIFDASLEDLALIQLEEGVDFVGDRDPLETDDKAWQARVRFKATAEFVELMDDFIARLPETAFSPRDYQYGEWNVPGEWIWQRIQVYQRFPLMERLNQVADDIHSRLENEFFRDEAVPHRNTILQALRKMLRFKTTLSLYREFYRQIGQPKLYKPFQRGVLEWNDVYPYLYLQAAFTGLQESRLIKHLVIDEMQDYTPIQYAVLNRLFPCPKTILGDFGQSIDPNRQYTLEQLHGLYPGSQLVRLEKSYRSTWEIIHFAKQLVHQADFEAVERHGEAPEVFAAATEEEELARLCQIVEEFHHSEYNALGIVTRTNGEAQALFEQLTSRGAQVSLVTPESKSFHNGALVLSVQMSKGLEFDQVAVPHVNAGTYHTPFDRNLLYVACTRAMHRLALTYTGDPSPLLPGEAGEE
ncbi:MAG TPA: ATP-binding domain-containing protein [Candidatus Acutalibacter stercorigallinarum]|nr:ATP-binding domain-containing protein [Candidatus Acutalibacter stercorigallinarum]